MGVQMQAVTPALAKAIGRTATGGVLVDTYRRILAGHRQAAAGRRHHRVQRQMKAPRDLAMEVAEAHSGSAAKLSVWRNGAERPVDVTIGQQKAQTAANERRAGRRQGRTGPRAVDRRRAQ